MIFGYVQGSCLNIIVSLSKKDSVFTEKDIIDNGSWIGKYCENEKWSYNLNLVPKDVDTVNILGVSANSACVTETYTFSPVLESCIFSKFP